MDNQEELVPAHSTIKRELLLVMFRMISSKEEEK